MTTNTHAAAIKSFVIETLGCRCPESVFEQIDDDETSTLPGLETPFKRLLIGHRLLIYIVECDDATALQTSLPLLVENGKAERDDQGYNRVRVVIATDQPQSMQHEADLLFSSPGDEDEKVHLRVHRPRPKFGSYRTDSTKPPQSLGSGPCRKQERVVPAGHRRNRCVIRCPQTAATSVEDRDGDEVR